MKKQIALAFAAVATLASVTAAYAHHSFSMFDHNQEIVMKGKVVRWAFTSPHTFMIMENEADGQVWAFEGSAPPALLNQTPSMKGDTFTAGQEITLIMCPLRDGRNGGAVGLIVTADGTIYNPADGGCRAASTRKDQWADWLAKGYTSKAEAEAAEPAQKK
jgi:hypothetical protein